MFMYSKNICIIEKSQSIVKEISCEYSLEGLMLKLKLQYFGHLMQRTDFNFLYMSYRSIARL